jgi:hypothetical protein
MKILKNKKQILVKGLIILAALGLILTTFLPFLSFLL